MKSWLLIIAAVVSFASPAYAFMDTINNGPQAEANVIDTNINTNTNVNTNTNTNVNVLGQQQGQLQGQAQKQAQGQLQAQGQAIIGSANTSNSNNSSQEVTFISPENKRELPGFYGYQAPQWFAYRGPFEKGVAGKAKPWRMSKKQWASAELDGFYSAWDSAKCKLFQISPAKDASETLTIGTKDVPIAILECEGASDLEIWGAAGKKALEAGAKFIEEAAYAATFINKSSGWNLGFGGGVTAVNGGNDVYGASVGGGTGIGSASSEPIEKIKVVFFLF